MEEFDFALLCVALIYALAIWLTYVYSAKNYADNLNPLAVLCCFSFLDAFGLIWFSVKPELREMLIYSQISIDEHKSDSVVLASYALSLIGFLCIAGAAKVVLPKNECKKVFLINSKSSNGELWYGFVIWFVGLLATFYFVHSFGGIQNLWNEYLLQGRELENFGYFNLFAQAFIFIGSGVMYVDLYNKKHYSRLFIVLLLSVLCLSIFGNRSPVLLFILMILFVHNYKIKKIESIINITTISVGGGFLVLALILVGLRPGSNSYLIGNEPSFEEKISRDLIMRTGTLERKMVTIGYFDLDKIWLGKSYYSLLVAPIPRSVFENKPAVDTGVYLKEIADGGSPEVNAPANMLAKTSWPEGNLAGWMNFHIIGYIFLSLLSGALYGLFYKKMIATSATFLAIFFYINLCYWGAPNLSPYGIVRLFSSLFVVLLLYFMYKTFVARRRVF